MSRSNKSTEVDLAIRVLDVYIAPLLLLGIGVTMAILSVTTTIPEGGNLVKVSGHLDSYYHKQTGRGRDDYTTIVVFKEGSRFWTNAVKKDSAGEIFGEPGVEVGLYYDPHSTDTPLDGAMKSYGLWVDGAEIDSLNSSLADEKSIVHLGFPAVAIFAVTVAILIYRRNRTKYAL